MGHVDEPSHTGTMWPLLFRDANGPVMLTHIQKALAVMSRPALALADSETDGGKARAAGKLCALRLAREFCQGFRAGREMLATALACTEVVRPARISSVHDKEHIHHALN